MFRWPFSAAPNEGSVHEAASMAALYKYHASLFARTTVTVNTRLNQGIRQLLMWQIELPAMGCPE